MNPRLKFDDARPHAGERIGGFLASVVACVTTAIAIVVGAMFSIVVMSVVLLIALVVFGYVWWKTRDLRRVLRERPPGGRIIEGEVVREHDEDPR